MTCSDEGGGAGERRSVTSPRPITIGFATTCMNRRWQLEQTLASNLATIALSAHFIALCDFNSGDDLGRLVGRFASEVRSGTLLYFRTTEPRRYHSSVAKNTAHRLALIRRPDVLFNLDADNRIDRETIALVARVFGADRDSCLHNWSGDWGSGTCGRVALSAQRWRELGGYDEGLLPVGWQDLDLLYRARLIGLPYHQHARGVGPAVPNSDGEKLANVDLPPAVSVPDDDTRSYTQTLARNIILALGRPARLRFEDQRRFTGTVNFSEPALI
jgi:hypothetical protein